jgi:hypothetical protein
MLALGGPSVLAVLGRGTIYRTNDAGETWAAIGRAPDINEDIFLAAAALGPDGRLYAGLAEGGLERGWVYRTAEVVTASEPSIEPSAEEALRVEVHPNPADGTATAAFTLREPSEVEAVLYDELGRRVAVLHKGPMGAGEHPLPLYRGALPAGVYVVRVAAGGAVVARTVTLIR